MILLRMIYYITLFIIFAIIVWQVVYFSFDSKSIEARHKELREKLKDSNLQSLLNGSSINNIPILRIANTGNNEVDNANKCSGGPIQVSQSIDFASTAYCQKFCANKEAKSFTIGSSSADNEEENVIYGGKILNVGSYCTIGPRPECNLKKTYAIMTLNTITCRSKYPNIIGGPLGNKIIACNDSKIYDPKNKLWDWVENEEFDPLRTRMLAENETYVENGVTKFRFRCKFDGYDERGNKYIENPANRFHPMENWCAKKIYRAHPDVETKFYFRNSTPFDYSCECGDRTGVQNIIPNDRRSQCASAAFSDKRLAKNKFRKTIIYDCFNLYSKPADVGRMFPCSEENYLRQGNQFDTIELEYTYMEDDPIEHPLYDKFEKGLERTSEGFKIEI